MRATWPVLVCSTAWALTVERAPLAQPCEPHGRTVRDDVVAVHWTATSPEAWLPDAHYDEFVLRGQAPAQPGALWFQVQQLCEKGQWNWSEVPATGISKRGLKSPAVLLEVPPAQPAAHPH